MRNLTFFIFLLALPLWGCSGGGDATAGQAAAMEDTAAAVPAAEPVRPAMLRRHNRTPFEKALSQGKIRFELSSPNVPQENTLVVAPSGFENRNDTFQIEVAGLVFDAQLGDLNKDGFPEVYVFSRSAGSDSTSYAYAFASYKNLSYGLVNVRELAVKPELAQGFKGHDRFFFEGGALKRSFPISESGSAAAGRRRIVTYTLYQGESSFILEPSSGEMVE